MYLQDVVSPVGVAVLHGCKALHGNGTVAGIARLLQGGARDAIIGGVVMAAFVPASALHTFTALAAWLEPCMSLAPFRQIDTQVACYDPQTAQVLH